MKCSICIAAHNKPRHLDLALESIFRQSPPFEWEVVVAIDGEFPETYYAASKYLCRVIRVQSPGHYRNPSVARNVAYKAACGEVMILQSDDVQHMRPDTIERLVSDVSEDTMLFATVLNVDEHGNKLSTYCGPRRRRPFFFLGSVHRKHVFKIGGNSEDFTGNGFDDNWLGDCLMFGCGLKPVFSDSIIGHHLDHPRPNRMRQMRDIYQKKVAAAQEDHSKWIGGPEWPIPMQ